MDHDHESGTEDHPSDNLAWPWGPPGEPTAPQQPSRRGQAGWTKKVGLGAAAVGLAGGAFGIVWAVTSGSGSSSSATSAPAAASQSASSSDPAQSLVDPGESAPGPGQGGPGRFGFGFRGPFGGAGENGHKPTPGMAGTVKSVSGQTVTIQDFMGFTRTIHTSSSTSYTKGGQSATSSAVTSGTEIAAQGTVDKNGTDLDASKVAVLLPSVAGTVQSVSGQSFVVQGVDGAKHTVTTTGSTTFHQGRSQQASLSDVKQGVRVVATGDRQSNGDLTASAVQILPARPQHPPNGSPPAPPGGGAQSGSTT